MNLTDANTIWEGIFTCPTHFDASLPMHMEQHPPVPDCDDCMKEAVARDSVIDQLQAEAANRVAGLAKSGLDFPSEVVAGIRLELLIDSLFRDSRIRAMFEGECGRRVIMELKKAQELVSEAEKQKIQVPEKKLTVVKDLPKGAPKG